MNKADLIRQISLSVSELRISSANEATTRLKLIDDVIFGLLEWPKSDVKVETSIREDGSTEFLDYEISSGRVSILIEAKRIGKLFSDLPKAKKAQLRGKWVANDSTGAAICQARDYGRKRGVGFCIATNGVTWIVFPINRRDQVTFEDSLAVIFQDIDDTLRNDPGSFIELLARQAVIAGSLDRELLGSDKDQTDVRRLNQIYDKTFSKVNRKSIFPYIEREIITAFNDDLLSANPELLEKCYVETPERIRFDERIRMYVLARDQVLRTRPIRPVGKKGDSKAVSALLETSKLSSRPITLVTLGLVGSGKTTFLNHTAMVSGAGQFAVTDGKPEGCWVYVDFRDYSTSEHPKHFMVDRVFDYLKKHPFISDFEKSVQPAYKSEIDALRRGPLAMLSRSEEELGRAIAELLVQEFHDKEPYCGKIVSYWARKFPIFLVIDNVDQIERPESQSAIFLEAIALARTYGCNLILAMRDSTFVKNRSAAVFNAFDLDYVYIDAPNTVSVLSKRFTVAAQLLRDTAFEFEAENGAKMRVRDASLIVELLRDSVLGTDVGRIIEVAATGDTRLALQMTRQFLQFGYSSTGKALQIYQQTGRYRLPEHEAIRAILIGNQSIYREEFSPILNPFDAHIGRTDVQSLRLFIMQAVVSYSAERSFDGISVSDILREMETIGIPKRDTLKVVGDLLNGRFLFTKSHQDWTEESIVVPSRLCGFVVKVLVAKLAFVETVMFDTFVPDRDAWELIRSNMAAVYRERNTVKKFGIRKEIAAVFFKACEDNIEKLVQSARSKGLPPQWCSNPLSAVGDEFNANLAHALRSAVRNNTKWQPDEQSLFKGRSGDF